MDLDTVNPLKAKGNKAFLEQKYDEALKFYKEALDSAGPEDSKVAAILHSNIAQAYLEKKDYSLAVESATESLKLDPSFKKSNLRRAIANVELDNITNAVKDLRLILSHEPNNKAAKDLKRRLDLPKMNQELHDLYVKHYLRQMLKKLGSETADHYEEIRHVCVKSKLLRQTFLSTKGLDVTNFFFRKAVVGFCEDQITFVAFSGWIERQFLQFKDACSATASEISNNLFKLLYHLFRAGTFSLMIYSRNSMLEETLSMEKYLDVFLSKEGTLLPSGTLDNIDLRFMLCYSDYVTRMVYISGHEKFEEMRFPVAEILTFDGKHAVTNGFLESWKKNKWPVKSVSFAFGFPNLRAFKRFDGVVSRKVKNVFIQFAADDHPFNKIAYSEACKNLAILERVFPNITDVTIVHWYRSDVVNFRMFVQALEVIRKAYDAISTKPNWCSKLKVITFSEFKVDSRTKFKFIDFKLMEEAIDSLRQQYPDMQLRLCGPRVYDTIFAKNICVDAVVKFENEAAQFEVAFFGVMN